MIEYPPKNRPNTHEGAHIALHLPNTSLYSLRAYLKKRDNGKSFWNIPFYIHPTTSLYSQKAFLKEGQ
jgi:hypothetical protein